MISVLWYGNYCKIVCKRFCTNDSKTEMTRLVGGAFGGTERFVSCSI